MQSSTFTDVQNKTLRHVGMECVRPRTGRFCSGWSKPPEHHWCPSTGQVTTATQHTACSPCCRVGYYRMSDNTADTLSPWGSRPPRLGLVETHPKRQEDAGQRNTDTCWTDWGTLLSWLLYSYNEGYLNGSYLCVNKIKRDKLSQLIHTSNIVSWSWTQSFIGSLLTIMTQTTNKGGSEHIIKLILLENKKTNQNLKGPNNKSMNRKHNNTD